MIWVHFNYKRSFVVFCNLRKLSCYLFLSQQPRGSRGPIFEDGPNFDMAFKLFHGKDGVVPLSGRSSSSFHGENVLPEPATQFNPLAAKAATISLSAFGGPFSFDFFSEKWKKNQKRKSESSKKVRTLYF